MCWTELNIERENLEMTFSHQFTELTLNWTELTELSQTEFNWTEQGHQ